MAAQAHQRVAVPANAAELTPEWITEALGIGVAQSAATVPFGMGNAASTVRLNVTWAPGVRGPDSFVVKVPAAAGSEQRHAADGWGLYAVEAMFYASLAADLKADTPKCYWAGHDADAGTYAVVLEDLGHLTAGDDVTGGDPTRAGRAIGELALVHGPRWGDAKLAELTWLNRYPRGQGGVLHKEMTSAVARLDADYADELPPDVLDLGRRFALLADRYDRKGFGGPRTIVHQDFRDDNLMFGPDRVCILDWQTVQLGAGLADLAYYLAASLRTEDRRAHEDGLVRSYHQRLLAQGVELAWDTCWRDYRRHGLALLTTILKFINQRPDLPQRTRQLMVQMIRRGAHQAMDLDSLNLLTA
jgi:hypothetical protein